jgi:hypothetical protein
MAALAALILLTACGSESEDGDSGVLSATPETKQGAMELPSIEGKQTYHYAIDLPPTYGADLTQPRHRWQVKGTKGKVAPHVQVWMAKAPPTLEAAVKQSSRTPMGERKVVFQEETEHGFIVVARDPDGKWTQVDGWCKGDLLTPYCVIELHKVAENGKQVEWAKQVARSLRTGDAPAGNP